MDWTDGKGCIAVRGGGDNLGLGKGEEIVIVPDIVRQERGRGGGGRLKKTKEQIATKYLKRY